MAKYYSIALFLSLVICSSETKAQERVLAVGYQQSDVSNSVTIGITSVINTGFELFIGDHVDGNSAGIRFERAFTIFGDSWSDGPNLYVGPHLGVYTILSPRGDNNASFNYGISTGVYVYPVNLGLSYGIDNLFKTDYLSIKIGYDFLIPGAF